MHMGHDLRKYARQTSFQLVIGFLVLLFIVGDGLIFVFYGRNAAIMGLVCILAGISPLILIYLALWFIDWFAKSNRLK
jgi:multisubunit Na+/H+ antiporter MnhB subunit